MTVDEKIGQLFVYVTPGPFMNEESPRYRELLRQVRENHVGGIHWATWSNVFETAFVNRRLQRGAPVRLLVSADLEAGVGMRFADTTYWPWPMAVGATGDADLARREGEIVAEEALAIGVNQIYAPVADVNSNPDNPVINVRSFGEDPDEVARFVVAFVRGVESRGVIATVKHFPGHGDTRTDSHRSLPVLPVTRDRLEKVELVPFKAAIAAGASAVMTAHLSFPALEDTPVTVRSEGVAENPYTNDAAEASRDATLPASLSPKITDGLLRGELGFQGLVVTDALDMGGIVDHFDAGEAAVLAILAGADEVLKSSNTDAAIAGVKRAVASGRITSERLDLSVRRILAAKARLREAEPDLDHIFRVVDSPAHRAVVEEIARRSVTLVREGPGALPLDRRAKVFLLVVSEVDRSVGGDLGKELRSRLETPPETAVLDARSGEADVAAALAAASRASTVLLALFVRFQSGHGSIALPGVTKGAIERLLDTGARVVAVSFGSPYVIRDLPRLPTYFCAWGSQPDMQVAAARALFGDAAITGRLPVTIPGVAPRGAGIQKPAAARTAFGCGGRFATGSRESSKPGPCHGRSSASELEGISP
jgi:beta-N-acetylhexosaminidase